MQPRGLCTRWTRTSSAHLHWGQTSQGPLHTNHSQGKTRERQKLYCSNMSLFFSRRHKHSYTLFLACFFLFSPFWLQCGASQGPYKSEILRILSFPRPLLQSINTRCSPGKTGSDWENNDLKKFGGSCMTHLPITSVLDPLALSGLPSPCGGFITGM